MRHPVLTPNLPLGRACEHAWRAAATVQVAQGLLAMRVQQHVHLDMTLSNVAVRLEGPGSPAAVVCPAWHGVRPLARFRAGLGPHAP